MVNRFCKEHVLVYHRNVWYDNVLCEKARYIMGSVTGLQISMSKVIFVSLLRLARYPYSIVFSVTIYIFFIAFFASFLALISTAYCSVG